MRKKLRAFASSPSLAPPPDPPDFDFDEVMSLLPGAADEARNVENVASLHDESLAIEYADALGTAIGYIQSIAPSEILPSLVASTSIRPGDLDVSEFCRRYDAVDRPIALLDDLAAGTLVPDQVDALMQVYPDLYSLYRTAILQEMTEAGGAKADYQLPYGKDLALQVLLGTETLDSKLHGELLKVFSEAREKESGKSSSDAPSKSRKGIGDASTVQERVEAK